MNRRYSTVKAVEVSGRWASSVVFSPLVSCRELPRNLQGTGHLDRALISSTREMVPEARA